MSDCNCSMLVDMHSHTVVLCPVRSFILYSIVNIDNDCAARCTYPIYNDMHIDTLSLQTKFTWLTYC